MDRQTNGHTMMDKPMDQYADSDTLMDGRPTDRKMDRQADRPIN